MYRADMHTHSELSIDSKASLASQIETAIRLGLDEIVITDHYDYDKINGEISVFMDLPRYIQEVTRYQELYKNQITIRLGLEVGYEPQYHALLTEMLQSQSFDFVIASTHRADTLDLYNYDFFKGKSQKEAYRRYFENVLETVTHFEDFDIYGHIDYVNRYGDYENKILNCSEYTEMIESILDKLIATGKGLEVNTSGLRYGLGHFNPQIPILRRYYEKGGEVITVGSDSHCNQHIGYLIDEAYKMLAAIGFKYYTTFEKRKPLYHLLEK